MKNSKKGFTLIELLVVVAIIGVLASVVLAALSSANSKGKDAAIKTNLKNAIGQAEIFYGTNSASRDTYTNVCSTTSPTGGVNTIASFVNAAAKVGGVSVVSGVNYYTQNGTGAWNLATCNDSAIAWAAEVPLTGSATGAGNAKMWCVDSTGKSLQRATSIGATTACPAS